MRSLIGRKVGMTTIFIDHTAVPVTVIEAGPCYVLEVKLSPKDGYNAIKVGFEETSENHLTKPQLGICKKAGAPPLKAMREIRQEEDSQFAIGSKLTVELFKEGEAVCVSAFSKGKGFQGVMKRWGFAGGSASHGSMSHRRSGAIGNRTTPGKIFKGKKMPGHMGSDLIKARNLQVVRILPERNLLLVKGSIPGARGSLVFIEEEKKWKN